MRRRLALCAILAAGVLLAAGCGSGGSVAGGGAAGIVPASAPVFVALNTDLEGDQLTKARALLDKFPGSSGALRTLEAQLGQQGVDFERDVRPALGPELDVVVMNLREGAISADVVALLQPGDKAKLDALLKKDTSGAPPVQREIDGWTAIADSTAVLDRFEQARGDQSLEDSDAFKEAMDGLPGDTLAKVYVDTSALVRSAAADAGPQLDQLFSGSTPPVGAAATAEDGGIRLDATAKTTQKVETFSPELPSALPAGVLAYVGFGNLSSGIRDSLNKAGEQNPQLDQQIAQLELALGLSLDKDVLPLFGQEGAVAVYRGPAGTPVVDVLLKVDDAAGAVTTLDRVFERAAQFASGSIRAPQALPGGQEGSLVEIGGNIALAYAAVDGKLALSSTPDGLAALQNDGPRLADDAAFKGAEDAAGVPGDVTGLVYVDVAAAADLAIRTMGAAGELPPQVTENVKPLQSLMLYSTKDGDRTNVSGFLAIK